MSDVPLRTSDAGLLIEPNLHDGWLVGIRLPSRDSVLLFVTDLAGHRYSLILDGVAEFFATNLRQGNIISHVSVVRGAAVSRSDLRPLGDMDQGVQRSDSELQRILSMVHRDGMFVLEVSPSYGCHLICVARELRIHREGGD